MQNEQNYRDILRIEFESRKARNQYYSLRAFAQSIGIGSGALSEILNGKRNLGINKASSIIENLNFDDNEKEAFLNSVKNIPSQMINSRPEETSRELSIEIFEIVSSPVCVAILAAADLDDFILDIDWIARKLSLKYVEVNYALNLMRKVGLIETINGVEHVCEEFVLSPDGIPSRAIKNFHHRMLDKASEALEEQSVDIRDISGASFAMDSEDIPKLKKEIAKFRNRIIKKYSANKKDQVYHVEFALFALSGGEK